MEETQAESRKKNLAVTAIATLAALNNESVTIYIILAISIIALAGMSWQGVLDWMRNLRLKPKKLLDEVS